MSYADPFRGLILFENPYGSHKLYQVVSESIRLPEGLQERNTKINISLPLKLLKDSNTTRPAFVKACYSSPSIWESLGTVAQCMSTEIQDHSWDAVFSFKAILNGKAAFDLQ